MVEAPEAVMNKLINKVQQHEKTIAQLVEMIGATNCRISEMALENQEEDQSCMPS